MFRKCHILIIMLVCFSLLGGCSSESKQPTTVEDETTNEGDTISVTGVVIPSRRATLSLGISGYITELLVSEGQAVTAGQVLLRIDNAQQKAVIAEAQAMLAISQNELNALKNGAREEEIQMARAAVDAAEARLARLNEGPLSEEIAVAQAKLAEAQASLQLVLDGPSDFEIIAARSEVANAEAQLRQAQSAYDQVKDRADIGALPESVQLEQATNIYNSAKAHLQSLEEQPKPAEIAAARARVQQAQAELERIKAPARPSEISEADAERDRAQANLNLLEKGARPEDIAIAEAEVTSYQAKLTAAEAELAKTELLAPFSGTVALLTVRTGEEVTAFAPLMQIGDLSDLQVETTDLNEIEITKISIGSNALVTFDALPEVQLDGKVINIAPKAKPGTGVYYTVTVDIDNVPDNVRWDMTAFVDITPTQ